MELYIRRKFLKNLIVDKDNKPLFIFKKRFSNKIEVQNNSGNIYYIHKESSNKFVVTNSVNSNKIYINIDGYDTLSTNMCILNTVTHFSINIDNILYKFKQIQSGIFEIYVDDAIEGRLTYKYISSNNIKDANLLAIILSFVANTRYYEDNQMVANIINGYC